jgi:tetratricopeptide (TPR) repeat protein
VQSRRLLHQPPLTTHHIMSIKFNCPHCKKSLNVKDHLAGKKALCPACKQGLTVPAPVSQPADLEEFAAAALAHQSETAGPAPEPTTIEFTCYYCDANVRVNAELAGKQTPCPECRRIVKVPLLQKKEAKDWRTVDSRLPSGARQSAEPAPEGAWDARAVGTVSRQALLEAQALPQVKKRLTWLQWTKRGLTAAAVLAVVGLAAWFIRTSLARYREEQALAKALDYLQNKDKLTPEVVAELHGAVGEYYIRANKRDDARNHFQEARAELSQAGNVPPTERDLALTDLALSQIELGGDRAEVERGYRLSWDDAHKEVRQSLQYVQSREGRAEALRRVTRKLLGKGQGARAPALGSLFPEDAPELLALIGLEMLRAKQDKEALMLAGQAQQLLPPPPPKREGEELRIVPPPASLVALWMALGKSDNARALTVPPEGAKGPEATPAPALVAATAEGMALQGNIEQARASLRNVSPIEHLLGLLAVAEVAIDNGQTQAAVSDLEEALNLAEGDWQGKGPSPWLLYRLVRLGAEAGLFERMQATARLIPDASLRGRARLEILRWRLAQSKAMADLSWADAIDKPTAARSLAALALARHNAGYDRGTAQMVDGWEEAHRPFGYIGVALGIQDASR